MSGADFWWGVKLGPVADWAAKLNGAIARIAGLLHLARNLHAGYDRPISAATVEAAARIGHYYLAHALAVFDHMDADPVVDGARTILDWIDRTGRDRFTRREYFSVANRSRFKKTTDLDAPLQLLEQHGHIRTLPKLASSRQSGRPPSPTYLVNPRH